MRCLHCNKKLSLLKLAKGDSFCSPEHFDAYQLQLSKNAYERLISLPDEETPKAPLVFKTAEPPPVELEADSAMARLSAFRAQEKLSALPPPFPTQLPPRAGEFKAPPYAGFLASPLPSFPPHGIFPSLTDANEPVAGPRNVAFPVHDVEATACILNLYLRLSLSDTPPRNWARVLNPIATPEPFPREIAQSSLAIWPSESASDGVTSDRMLTHGGSLVPTEEEPRPSGSGQAQEEREENEAIEIEAAQPLAAADDIETTDPLAAADEIETTELAAVAEDIETAEPLVAAADMETTEPVVAAGDIETTDPLAAADDIETTELAAVAEDIETAEPLVAAADMETTEPVAAADDIETTEPVVAAGDMETAEPLAAADDIETTEPVVAADDMETAEPLVVANDIESAEPLAAADDIETVEPLAAALPIEPAGITETAPIHFIEIDFVGPPAPVPVDTIVVLPVRAPPAEPVRPAARRLAFLLAPSFRERDGEPKPFDTEASSAPRNWKLPPLLDRVQLPARWSGTIPRSSGFSENKAVAPQDAIGERVQSGYALPTEAGILLPEKRTIDPYQWQALDSPIDIARPPLATIHLASRATDYAPPQPAPVRPNATLTPGIDRGQILTASRNSLLRSVLEVRPRGDDPLFRMPAVGALAVTLPAILAPLAAWEGFKARTWKNQVGRLSLPTSVADAESALASLPSLAMPGSHAFEPANAGPAPSELIPATRLPPPLEMLNHPVVSPSTLLGSIFDREFTLAASADFGLSSWSAVVSTRMLPARDITQRSKVGLCTLTANWQPCLPVRQDLGLSKFLPVRRSPILPPARPWPRLGALPQ